MFYYPQVSLEVHLLQLSCNLYTSNDFRKSTLQASQPSWKPSSHSEPEKACDSSAILISFHEYVPLTWCGCTKDAYIYKEVLLMWIYDLAWPLIFPNIISHNQCIGVIRFRFLQHWTSLPPYLPSSRPTVVFEDLEMPSG